MRKGALFRARITRRQNPIGCGEKTAKWIFMASGDRSSALRRSLLTSPARMSSNGSPMMKGVFIEGNKKVTVRRYADEIGRKLISSVPVPEPGPGEILLKTKASSICGSDLHCIYRPDPSEWTRDAEGYFGVIAGHERKWVIRFP